ncbi:hypothetical protein STVA_14770 [Allostella vacuolata]|nr:hypothetical protein STVA_14770 [Stella vacuolata]
MYLRRQGRIERVVQVVARQVEGQDDRDHGAWPMKQVGAAGVLSALARAMP